MPSTVVRGDCDLAINFRLRGLTGPGISLFPRATSPDNGRPVPASPLILFQNAGHNQIQPGTPSASNNSRSS